MEKLRTPPAQKTSHVQKSPVTRTYLIFIFFSCSCFFVGIAQKFSSFEGVKITYTDQGVDFTKPDWTKPTLFESAFSGIASLDATTEGVVNYARSPDANVTILGWSQRYQPVTTPTELKKITIPVLVVAGNKDLDNGDPRALFQLFSNGSMLILRGDHNTTYRKAPFAKGVMTL